MPLTMEFDLRGTYTTVYSNSIKTHYEWVNNISHIKTDSL